MSKPKITDNFEIIGSGKGSVDTNTEDFKALQHAIIEHAKKIPPAQRIKTQLYSLKLKMEAYLKKDKPEKILTLGYFLKKMVAVLNIKHKQFAEYVGYQESNLSSVFNDKRKISTDLAIKFGEIFEVNPALFLHIQSKNELLNIQRQNKEVYKKYRMKDLLEIAGVS
ncbi:MAG: helix-turn-helix transcriptional regulator [Chitinophagales bacterium]